MDGRRNLWAAGFLGWGDETIQSLLEGCKRNKHVYERIACDLEENGYERTWSQCRDKIKE